MTFASCRLNTVQSIQNDRNSSNDNNHDNNSNDNNDDSNSNDSNANSGYTDNGYYDNKYKHDEKSLIFRLFLVNALSKTIVLRILGQLPLAKPLFLICLDECP